MNKGFTLLELLITVSIAAIICACMVPSLKNYFQKSQSEIIRSDLLQAIHLARNEAVIRDGTVTLSKSTDDWQNGYNVISDDKVLFKFHYADKQNKLFWRAFPYYLDHLEFLSSGLPNFQNGTFWFCMKDSDNPSWAIMISQSGRARVVYPNEESVIEDEKGKRLVC